MNIDLHTDIPKVTAESERQLLPEETEARARESLARLGLELGLVSRQVGDLFWLTWLDCDIDPWLPAWARAVRIGGKGTSEAQSRASCAMELVERLSLYRHIERRPQRQRVWDLRGERWLELAEDRSLTDTACTASGNAMEDALLHALHELVETRGSRGDPWKPTRVVPLDAFDLPAWVRASFVALMLPTASAELCHVVALRSPDNGRFDPGRPRRLVEAGGRLFVSSWRPPPSHHSPNSGGAAGLSPRHCLLRALGEALQSDPSLPTPRRRPAPPHLPRCGPEDLRDRSTDSITGDIRLLLDLLGPEVFVGVLDVTDPEVGLPVIKLVSDYEPDRSLASRDLMGLFFDL